MLYGYVRVLNKIKFRNYEPFTQYMNAMVSFLIS